MTAKIAEESTPAHSIRPHRRRRNLLGTVAAGVVLSFAGCVTPTDFPRYKTLGIERIDTEEVENGWKLTVTVFTGVNRFEGRQADFHNVVLLGYAHDGSLVCKRRIGDIENDGGRNLVTVELQCPRLPDVLTFRAEETPCDEDTEISVYKYRGTPQDLGHYWSDVESRECNEGLPPDV